MHRFWVCVDVWPVREGIRAWLVTFPCSKVGGGCNAPAVQGCICHCSRLVWVLMTR